MSLRREFRSQLTEGVWQFAIVEGVSMGKATVRLAPNGARLTNLSILGAAVAVGEKVIVDYSAEGPPIVRPYTIPGVELDEPMEEPKDKEPDPTQFVYGKFTVSDEEIAHPTLIARYTNYGNAEPGFLYGSWNGQYQYTSNFYNTIPFDEAIVDTANVLSPTEKGRLYLPNGSYFMSSTVALDVDMAMIGHMGEWTNLLTYINEYGFGINGYRRAARREHHLIVQQSAITKISQGTPGTTWVRGVLDNAGGNIYSSSETSSVPDWSKATYAKLAKKEGAYPILEVYKIADIGPRRTHVPFWTWLT